MLPQAAKLWRLYIPFRTLGGISIGTLFRPPILCMNKHPLRLDYDEHAAKALRLIHHFFWLRPTELGRFIYPRNPHGRKYAEKLVRKLKVMRLVLSRKLPGRGAGTAYVIAARGAAQLSTWAGIAKGGYASGKDWGVIHDGMWSPPSNWRHDLLAIGVLSHLAENSGTEVISEAHLRRTVPDARKHPDGLVVCRSKGFSLWLEVESTRKSGKNLEYLVRALIGASRGKPEAYYDEIQDVPIRLGMLAISERSYDERGYSLDHWGRFERKLRSMGGLKSPVSILFCKMIVRGVGVHSIKLENVTLLP